MNFLHDIYKKTIAANEKNIKFWEDYLQNLNSLDFAVYSEKLTIPTLVPIGNRILFRGNLKHTNEVIAALGADYFAKCSIKQAEILRQHRIRDAKSNLEVYYKEKEYLQNQLTFSKQNIYEDVGQEIIEHCTDEEDREWRVAHREKVRQYNQSRAKKQENNHSNFNDEELWSRLEELEIQEELENELSKIEANNIDNKEEKYDSFVLNEDEVNKECIEEVAITPNIPHQTAKLNLLKHVIDRQKELATRLTELKNRDTIKTSTEDDLLSRLDEMEQLEELEDEIDRLDDILDEDSDEDDTNEEENVIEKQPQKFKQTVVTFNEDDNETLELTFKHSELEPLQEPYDTNKGITKPSDIYSAFSHLFDKETKSILKKSKHKSEVMNVEDLEKHNTLSISGEYVETMENRTIVIKDVSEKNEGNVKISTSDERPTSIFKKRRQLQKT